MLDRRSVGSINTNETTQQLKNMLFSS